MTVPRRHQFRASCWVMPRGAYYDATNPEECFATVAGAVRPGYRAALI